MREILYRAKAINRISGKEYRTDYKNGDWVYGLVTRLYDERFENCPAQMTNTDGISDIDVDYKTIGQYTGLTDKNGTRIFEGDIFTDKENEVIYVVEFRCGMFCLTYCEKKGAFMPYGYDVSAYDFCEYDCQPMDNYSIDEMQIDGNIHDNPVLLRKRWEK